MDRWVIYQGRRQDAQAQERLGDILKKIDGAAYASALALKVNGKLVDLFALVSEGENLVEVVHFSDPEGQEVFRHSTAHIMAAAVQELFPDVKVTIGPAIQDGFYYDFDRVTPFTPQDLEAIETKMKEITKQKRRFVREELPRSQARELFTSMQESYKLEILDQITDPQVSIYRLGEFVDLCRGPHVPNSGAIKAFKLLSIAGAYWRGDEKNKMLQRIYGTSFPTSADLDAYLQRIEEAKRRDHRKLGRELDLFSLHEGSGAGLVYWHPKGAMIRKTIEDFWRSEHLKNGYELLFTPHIGRAQLWETSGHLGFYRESMYSPMQIDEQDYYIKPMNCPFHIQIYQTDIRSYRQLPLRWAELGTVYRYEKSGVLHGLFRVRGFTQDDAHIFCTRPQLEGEIQEVIRFVLFVLKTFGFSEYEIYLSTKPKEGAVGSDDVWSEATQALRKALELSGLVYKVDEGGGAFYGPKVDIKIKDSLGRTWQCSTIQVDFNLPERFDVNYIGEDGKEHRAIMIHRALMGSLERFFGVLIEHYGGAFPLWLAPIQARICTISEKQVDFAKTVLTQIRQAGLRVDLDDRGEKINSKIRDAQMQKIPYMLVIGDREVLENKLALRLRTGENLGAMDIKEVIDRMLTMDKDKVLEIK